MNNNDNNISFFYSNINKIKDFLKKEFSYENLKFFHAVQQFKKLTNIDEVILNNNNNKIIINIDIESY